MFRLVRISLVQNALSYFLEMLKNLSKTMVVGTISVKESLLDWLVVLIWKVLEFLVIMLFPAKHGLSKFLVGAFSVEDLISTSRI